jgi:Rieske Fe-S protein
MNRKDFIRNCSWTLAGIAGSSAVMACIAGKNVHTEIRNGKLIVKRSTFPVGKFPLAAVIHRQELEFPICIYQLDVENFKALWMRCTHQGVELQLFGDRLICPAHGSEFSHFGEVSAGPASEGLRTFAVITDSEFIQVLLQ